MKKLLGIVVLGLLLSGNAYADLLLTCKFTQDTGYLIKSINKKKWCGVSENGESTGCADVSKYNSKLVKTEILKVGKSRTANLFQQDVYYMLDRRTGLMCVYSAKTNKIVSEPLMCEKRKPL